MDRLKIDCLKLITSLGMPLWHRRRNRNNCLKPVSLIVFRLHYNIYAKLVKNP